MTERGSCRACGAPILWVETEAGKRMPLDAEPERRFVTETHVLDDEEALARPGVKTVMRARPRNTYECHLATCPKRKECC